VTRRALASLLAAGALLTAARCARPLQPTEAAKRLARNPRATVEGRVVDPEGRPVAGVRVQAVPGGRDIIWASSFETDAEGRFRLALDAPAEYVFLILDGGTAVLTTSPRDPCEVRVSLQPGERRAGIELTFLRDERAPLLHPLEARSAR
jgi:hypothetical protein